MSRKPASPGKPAAAGARRKAGPAGGAGTDRMTRARAAWDRGDWAALAALGQDPLDKEPERAHLALLAAAGLAQAGEIGAARVQVARARDWGCSRRQVARVLVSGVFNTLGRVACLLEDDIHARALFDGAERLSHPDRNDIRSREIREKADLGLLAEAAGTLEAALDTLSEGEAFSTAEAAMFKSQIDLLNHTLGIAMQRGQLVPGGADDAAGLEQRATSQLGQDLWVLERTGHKRGGFFVEFGATDGVLLSNTYLLETEFGWNGILAEPNPAFFEKLTTNRHCTLAPDCIMGETGAEVEFILADEYGGVADFADTDAHVDRRGAFREAGRVLRLPTISLDDFLTKYGAPRRIDYLSIDTEGTEYEILKAFPFDKWDIRLLTVEHNFTALRDPIRELLEGQGYTRIEKDWDDWYYRA